MIYRCPARDAPVDQGDIIDGCPVLRVAQFHELQPNEPDIECAAVRVVVLTQTCDFANSKVTQVVVALAHDSDQLVSDGLLKAAEIRGPVRGGRVFGWYFLPKDDSLGLGESIVDFRQLHTVPLHVLTTLCQSGHRIARLEPLYREHLNKHFADTYSRIGLPEPYATDA